MHVHQHLTASLSIVLAFSLFGSISSAPTSSNIPNPAPALSLTLPQPAIEPGTISRVNISHSNVGLGPSISTNLSTQVGWLKTTWRISDTLSLALTVCNWELTPEKILHTLSAALTTVEKKPASGLLDGKFIQETGSRINNMIFEIAPEFGTARLTWGDVAEILGDERGLPKFFAQTQLWHTVYFDVIDSGRGMLGQGAVRKWYMLDSKSVTVG